MAEITLDSTPSLTPASSNSSLDSSDFLQELVAKPLSEFKESVMEFDNSSTTLTALNPLIDTAKDKFKDTKSRELRISQSLERLNKLKEEDKV
jgi:hypothetical protein